MEGFGIFREMMQTAVRAFDSLPNLQKSSKIEELDGSLSIQDEEDKLMHSVLEDDKGAIEDGKLINDSINQGIFSFSPDTVFEQMVKNFSLAKNIYGPSLIRLLSGYNPDYVKRNIHIPEFQRELKKRLSEKADAMKESGSVDKQGNFTDKGMELASYVMFKEELDNIIPKGILGEKIHKKRNIYGDKEDIKNFKRSDRYRDVAIRNSIKQAIRRGHTSLQEEDLKSFERKSKGSINVIYALDASGSMKGKKIEMCKKAGVALAYKAIEEKDKVGLIVFGSDIKSSIRPTDDFLLLLKEMTHIRAARETNMIKTIEEAIGLFPDEEVTKHLILITDAMPTVGKEEELLMACSKARGNKITVSLIGINLEEKGEALAKKIVEIGEGRLYGIKELENLDKIVLEDYYSFV